MCVVQNSDMQAPPTEKLAVVASDTCVLCDNGVGLQLRSISAWPAIITHVSARHVRLRSQPVSHDTPLPSLLLSLLPSLLLYWYMYNT